MPIPLPPPPPLPQHHPIPTPVPPPPRTTIKRHPNISPPIAKTMTATHPSHPLPSKPSTTPQPGPYFFYGSLQSSTQLSSVLSLSEPPVLVPAKITGYELKLWGPYPALFKKNAPTATNITPPAPPAPTTTAPVVHGKLYHVRTPEHAQRLANYETSAYRAVECGIWVPEADGTERAVKGWTFLFVGEERDVDEGEGVWDLEAWERRMGY